VQSRNGEPTHKTHPRPGRSRTIALPSCPGQNRRNNVRLPGVRLVISIVEQASETIELGGSAGTTFTIVVKEKEQVVIDGYCIRRNPSRALFNITPHLIKNINSLLPMESCGMTCLRPMVRIMAGRSA